MMRMKVAQDCEVSAGSRVGSGVTVGDGVAVGIAVGVLVWVGVFVDVGAGVGVGIRAKSRVTDRLIGNVKGQPKQTSPVSSEMTA